MLAHRLDPIPSVAASARRLPHAGWLLMLLALAVLTGCSSTSVRTARDERGAPLPVQGTVVLVEPDIELAEVLAGGMTEPRREWTAAARQLYSQAAREVLAREGIGMQPDYLLPPEVGPDDRRRQLLLLNQAVSMSILQFSQTQNAQALRNKHGRFDWSLGPGVSVLREATGADYALFTYIRDSYTSGGRAALRIAGLLLLGGDIGGGMQVGLASLVDLRTGQVVWHNVLIAQSGDLRTLAGARETTTKLLKGIRGATVNGRQP